MTARKMQTASDATIDPIEPEKADPQAPQDRSGLPEPRGQVIQDGASAKPAAAGRAPLFRR